MKHIGFLVNDMSFSELSIWLCVNLNANKKVSPVVFFENIGSPNFEHRFPIMDICYAWNFGKDMVATTLGTAEKLIGMPTNRRRFFYVWDLEWIRIKNKDYSSLEKIYRNESLELIARSEDHRKAILDAWNVDSFVVPYLDIDRLIEVTCL